jgi:hypothetical protein
MKTSALIISILALMLAVPVVGQDKQENEKKNGNETERAMLEKMDAVPCGANQKGITGLGYAFASAGLEHVSSNEKLCPEYVLRTDDTEYRIRSTDKHPLVLPVGQEGELKVKGSALYLRMVSGNRKMRPYQVVAEKPLGTAASSTPASEDDHRDNSADK